MTYYFVQIYGSYRRMKQHRMAMAMLTTTMATAMWGPKMLDYDDAYYDDSYAYGNGNGDDAYGNGQDNGWMPGCGVLIINL